MPLPGALSIYPGDLVRAYYRANAAPASFIALARVEHTKGWEEYTLTDYATDRITSFTTTWAETLVALQSVGSGGTGGCIVTGGGMEIKPSATSLVKGSFYARFIVTRSGMEECLCCGYLYDAKPFLAIGEHADLELGEAVALMDVTYTQANVAGGAIVVEIVPGSGNAFIVTASKVTNSGTNTLRQEIESGLAGASMNRYSELASGAGNISSVPQSAANGASSGALTASIPTPALVPGTLAWKIYHTGAGAQNDTLRVQMLIRVKGALPTVSKANSTNQADVSVTAGAASFAFVS